MNNEQSAITLALEASKIPAGIGAAIGAVAAMKGGIFLSLFVAGVLGAIFWFIAFLCVYAFHKLRGKR